MTKKATDPSEQNRIIDEFVSNLKRLEREKKQKALRWNCSLVFSWVALALAAKYYFWWCTEGEWRKHTANTLLAHDAVIYGPLPLTFGALWMLLIIVVFVLTIGRVIFYLNGDR